MPKFIFDTPSSSFFTPNSFALSPFGGVGGGFILFFATYSAKFFTLHSSFFTKIAYLCPRLSQPLVGWAGQDIDGTCPVHGRSQGGFVPPQSHFRGIKDVSERYLRIIKLRKLELSEDTATRRPRRVYYILMQGWIVFIRFIISCISHYNTHGVGWLSCLSG